MARTVFCNKLQQELPGLEQPPIPGKIGQEIYENVSAQAWEMWKEHQTILINHYALNPADPEDRKVLRAQMHDFFFGEGAAMPEGWSPAGSAPAAPSRKK
jgi:Fe-S cluster biosynthesis and repair protein YggX